MKLVLVNAPAMVAACLLTFAFGLVTAVAAEGQTAPVDSAKHADAKAAAQIIATNAVTILDVRTPGEFARGHIGGATNIDFLAGDFADRMAKLDHKKTYLVHCATGARSINSLPKLQRLGFTNLIHLDGGFKAWQAAGNPVEKK